MKRILAVVLAIFAASTFAATLNPIQLLNPAGSTSGQAIVSTGATTAPAWTTITPAAIGGLKASNNLSDVASAAAALTNLGGLSTTTAASTYLTQANATSTYGAKASPLSQFAATTSAQLAGVISDETGTGSLVLGTGPTINQPNIVGITSGIAAPAGSVGQVIHNEGAAVPLTSGTAANCTSITLTAGDWDVYGNVQYVPAGTTVLQIVQSGINTTSATLPGTYNLSQISGVTFAAGAAVNLIAPTTFKNVSASTSVYLVAWAQFTTSTLTTNCQLWARRRD